VEERVPININMGNIQKKKKKKETIDDINYWGEGEGEMINK